METIYFFLKERKKEEGIFHTLIMYDYPRPRFGENNGGSHGKW